MKHLVLTLSAWLVVLLVWGPLAHAQQTDYELKMSDYTGDGVIDAADYSVWRSSFGDFNQDHVVDSVDYGLWRQNFISFSGASENRFNGSFSGMPVIADALLAWRSVPLSAMFDTQSAYNSWVNRLTAAATLPGDYNSDSVVDAADYTVWRDTLLASATFDKFKAAAGDTNSDDTVDAHDYALWRENLGATGNENTPSGIAGDFNSDGSVNATDYTVWRDSLGSSTLVGTLGVGLPVLNAGSDWAWFIDPRTIHIPTLSGDLDHDGFVGIADLNIILGNWNKTTPPASFDADPNIDGYVGIEDLNIVLGNWNAGIPPGELNSGFNTDVPEPGALAVFMLVGSVLVSRRDHWS